MLKQIRNQVAGLHSHPRRNALNGCCYKLKDSREKSQNVETDQWSLWNVSGYFDYSGESWVEKLREIRAPG